MSAPAPSKPRGGKSAPPVTSLAFFSRLRWIDGRPLLDTIEPYRRHLFTSALDTFRPDGTPVFNLVLSGRGKKNFKTADLVLAALYVVNIRRSPLGNDAIIAASDEGQAGDDLALARKLVECNPDLAAEIEPLAKELRLRDGSGTLKIIPARDVSGAHGKTYGFLGIDELHTARDWSLLEALAPDPTREALTWITSYDSIYNTPGAPLYDLKQIAQRSDDPRMLFSWYSGGEICTDPDFAGLPPEERANPSMGSWPEGRAYLDQQRRRLPTHKFRRLHLNLPGAPDGAAFNADLVVAAIVIGRRQLDPIFGIDRPQYHAFVDMSGGSSDDAVLAIGHFDAARRKAVLDCVVSQTGAPPFNPRAAVKKFAAVVKLFGLSYVRMDAYAGLTFRQDFGELGISAQLCDRTKSELYDAFEPLLNAGEVELLDVAKLQEQALTLVVRGGKIDHMPGDHDDWANAALGALVLAHPHDLQGSGLSLMEWYRQQAAEADTSTPPPEFGWSAKPAAAAGLVRLQGPLGISQLTGLTGRAYCIDPDGTVAVSPEDADALKKVPPFGTWSEVLLTGAAA